LISFEREKRSPALYFIFIPHYIIGYPPIQSKSYHEIIEVFDNRYIIRGMGHDNIELKKCTLCKEEYPATENCFKIRRRKGKRHLSSWCKNCYREYNQQNSVKKRSKERLKEWKQNNPDKVKAQKRRNYMRRKRRERYASLKKAGV